MERTDITHLNTSANVLWTLRAVSERALRMRALRMAFRRGLQKGVGRTARSLREQEEVLEYVR